MKLETIEAPRLSNQECAQLRNLTLRSRGELAELLSEWRTSDEAKVVRLSDDNGSVLSWGLVRPYDGRGNAEIQLFTRVSQRRKGYGKIVFDALEKAAGGKKAGIVVKPHTSESIEFFNKVYTSKRNLPPFSDPFRKEKAQ